MVVKKFILDMRTVYRQCHWRRHKKLNQRYVGGRGGAGQSPLITSTLYDHIIHLDFRGGCSDENRKALQGNIEAYSSLLEPKVHTIRLSSAIHPGSSQLYVLRRKWM